MKIFKLAVNARIVDDLNADVKSVRFRFDPLYSGGPAFIDGFDHPAFVDLSTLRIDPDPKALLEHDPDQVVGRLENIVNDGQKITCEAVVGGSETAAKVVEWAQNVAPWSCSIGVYRFDDRDVVFLKNGEKMQVNGREAVGPAYVVKNGSLAEGSFVTIGGDGEARSMLAKFQQLTLKGKNMENKKFLAAEEVIDEKEKQEFVEAAVDDDRSACGESIDEAEKGVADDMSVIVSDAVEQAVDDAGAVVPAEIVDEVVQEIVDELADEDLEPVDVAMKASRLATKKLTAKTTNRSKASAQLAENRRVAGINALVATYGKQAGRIAAQGIANGWTLERTERVINAEMKRRDFVAGLKNVGFGQASPNNGPRKQNIVAAAFAKTLGLDDKRAAKAFGADAVDAATAKPYRGMTFRSVVAASLNSFKAGAYDIFTGRESGWSDCKSECLRAKLINGGKFRASADFSTISATDVFQLVLQAFLEPSEETAPRVYTKVTRENKVIDFNEFKSFLPTIEGRLRKISETGAIQNVTFTTQEFTRSASPFAAVFTIPEITVINDQIDTFAELLRQLEQLGDDCIEHDVAETFWRLVDGDIKDAAGNALVSTTVGNYISGGALDESGVGAAMAAMASFSNANGIPLAVDKLLLVSGSKLSPSAWKIAHSTLVNLNGGTAYPNYFEGRYTPIDWAYFDSAHARAKKDDGSTASLFAADKTWILLRDPSRRPAVCVNKVVGFESPRVEQFEADPAVWGTTYRYIYPYGVSVAYKDAIVATTNT